MFHHFHNEKHLKTQGAISEDDFEKILNHIGRERILSPLEWLERLKENKLKPEDLCLTFDDGLLSQIDIALPVLEHYGLKAFWFVYSGVFSASMAGQAGGEGAGNLEIYRFFRTKYFKNIDDFYSLFFERFSESGMAAPVNPALAAPLGGASLAQFGREKEGIQELRKAFPFYSENDARFRFLRDRVLGKENYEKLIDAILKERGASKAEIAENLWMSDKDLKKLSDNGHLIGLHSYSHPTALAELSFQEQTDEYRKNYSHLKKVSGKKPVAMSHPCNSYNEDTLKILKELGVYCGFLSNMVSKPTVKNPPAGSNLEIPREDHANIMRVLI